MALIEELLEGMSAHFLTQRRLCCWYGRMWSMVRLGREVWSRREYILDTDHRQFRNVAIRDPRDNSDYYLVLGCLRITSLREHTKYPGRRMYPPLWTPKPTRQGRTESSRPYGGRPQIQRHGRPGRTIGSWRTRGGSSTREYPHTRTHNKAKPSCDA